MVLLGGNNDLDKKLSASVKKILLERINFKEAKMVDDGENMSRKYKAINSGYKAPHLKSFHKTGDSVNASDQRHFIEGVPKPSVVLFNEDKVNLKWKEIRRIGPGLANLGNTCFLNSVLQVLTYTPPLSNVILDEDHKKKCQAVGFCMMCELNNHVTRIFRHNPHEGPVRPMSIIQKLKCIGKNFRFGRQEDAHEFLRYVIEGVQKSDYAGRPKLDKFSKETTIANAVFGGYYRSQVKCLHCQHESNTFDPMMDMNLDIKDCSNIIQALHKSIRADKLDGENKYHCERCRKKTVAQKRGNIHKEPNVLTFQLKRFDFTQMFGGKISKSVSFPEEFNVRPFMSKPQGPAIFFKLYAVLVHSGYSCNSGHYYCYVKAPNGTWYEMNDNRVCQVGLQTVLQAQAYLLFYVKKEKTKPYQNTVPTTSTPVKSKVVEPSNHSFTALSTSMKGSGEKKTLLQQASTLGTPVQRKPESKIVWNKPLQPAVVVKKPVNQPKMLDDFGPTLSKKDISKSNGNLTEKDSKQSKITTYINVNKSKSESHLNSLQKLSQSYEDSDSPSNSTPSSPSSIKVANGNHHVNKTVNEKENGVKVENVRLNDNSRVTSTPLKEIFNPTQQDTKSPPKTILSKSVEKIEPNNVETNKTLPIIQESPSLLKQKLSLSLNLNPSVDSPSKRKLSNPSYNGQGKFNRWTPITKAPLHPRVIIHKSHENRKHKEVVQEHKEGVQEQKEGVEEKAASPMKATPITASWKELPNISPGKLFGPMLPPPCYIKRRKRNDSLNSEASSVSSIHSRSGDWDIHEKQMAARQISTADILSQERQHVGWKVSVSPDDLKVQDNKIELPKVSEKITVEDCRTEENSSSGSRKRKHKEEHSDEVTSDSSKKKKKKRKHKKKKTKQRSRDISNESEDSEDESSNLKKKKKKKKKRKHKKPRSDDESESDIEEAPEKHITKDERKKKISKKKSSNKEKSHDFSISRETSKSRGTSKTRDEEKCSKSTKREKKERKHSVSSSKSRLVESSDDNSLTGDNSRKHPKAEYDGTKKRHKKSREEKSYSDDSMNNDKSKVGSKSDKTVTSFKWDEIKKKVKSWDGSNKSNSTLDYLLNKSTKVTSWTGEDSSKRYNYKEERETNEGELGQDEYDEEYDTGKVKKRKSKYTNDEKKEGKNEFQSLQDYRNHSKDQFATSHRSSTSSDHKNRHHGNNKKKNKPLDDRASKFF